MFIDGHMVYIM